MRPSALCCIVKIRTCPVLGIMTAELRRGARASRPKLELHAAAIEPHSDLGNSGRGELDTAVAATTKTFHNIVHYIAGQGAGLCHSTLEAPQPTEKGKGAFQPRG